MQNEIFQEMTSLEFAFKRLDGALSLIQRGREDITLMGHAGDLAGVVLGLPQTVYTTGLESSTSRFGRAVDAVKGAIKKAYDYLIAFLKKVVNLLMGGVHFKGNDGMTVILFIQHVQKLEIKFAGIVKAIHFEDPELRNKIQYFAVGFADAMKIIKNTGLIKIAEEGKVPEAGYVFTDIAAFLRFQFKVVKLIKNDREFNKFMAELSDIVEDIKSGKVKAEPILSEAQLKKAMEQAGDFAAVGEAVVKQLTFEGSTVSFTSAAEINERLVNTMEALEVVHESLSGKLAFLKAIEDGLRIIKDLDVTKGSGGYAMDAETKEKITQGFKKAADVLEKGKVDFSKEEPELIDGSYRWVKKDKAGVGSYLDKKSAHSTVPVEKFKGKMDVESVKGKVEGLEKLWEKLSFDKLVGEIEGTLDRLQKAGLFEKIELFYSKSFMESDIDDLVKDAAGNLKPANMVSAINKDIAFIARFQKAFQSVKLEIAAASAATA